jgi:hypothetical protein
MRTGDIALSIATVAFAIAAVTLVRSAEPRPLIVETAYSGEWDFNNSAEVCVHFPCADCNPKSTKRIA